MKENLTTEKITGIKNGESIKASGTLLKDAEFFQDHFPGFPVLPGVLALEILKQTAESGESKRFSLKKVSAVKFSAYLKPGDAWESEMTPVAGKQEVWKGRLYSKGELAAAAEFHFAPAN